MDRWTNTFSICKDLGFSCTHAQMWEVDYKEGWAPKNWGFRIVVLKTPENSLDCKEIKPVNLKGNQPWISTRRTDAEAPIFWPPDAKSWLIVKDPDAGKDWEWRRRGQQRMSWLDNITASMDLNLSTLMMESEELKSLLMNVKEDLQKDQLNW